MGPASFSVFSHVVIFNTYITGDSQQIMSWLMNHLPLPYTERIVKPNHSLNEAHCLALYPHRFVYK